MIFQSILLEVERLVITSIKAVQNSVKIITSDKTAAHLGSKQIRQNNSHCIADHTVII